MSNDEIEFCKYFEQNLLNKKTATWEVINTASKLSGRNKQVNCPDCGRYEYYDLLNYYGQIKPAWEQYLAEQNKPEKFVTTNLVEPKPEIVKPKTKTKTEPKYDELFS